MMLARDRRADSLVVLTTVLFAAAPTAAGDVLDPVFEVDRFEVGYVDPRPDLPDLATLVPFDVELVLSETG